MRTLKTTIKDSPETRREILEAEANDYYRKKEEAFADLIRLIREPVEYLRESFRGQRK